MLEVQGLTVKFHDAKGVMTAVNDISFNLRNGETLGLVGESGSGKSVTALALTRLLPEPPAFYEKGDVLLNGVSILRKKKSVLRFIRGREIAYVFQDPATSLNPVFSIYEQLAETIRLHRPEVRNVRREAIFWLKHVGIVDPEKRINDYPFQFSGGMQQRVMIAMALSCRPKILVADEPTTALDVTVQKQILDLLKTLKSNMSILLITHNFGIVSGLTDRVAVLFQGRLVEFGDTETVLNAPQHPYTRALISCVPHVGQKLKRLMTIENLPP